MLFIIYHGYDKKKYKCGLNEKLKNKNLFGPYKKKYLPNMYGNYGMDYIAPVIIPDKDICDTTENQTYVKLNKMYTGEFYYLYDIKTAIKFKLKITKTYINEFFASRHNTIKNFDFAFKIGFINDYDEELMDHASSCSRIDVLEWLKNSGLPLKYSEKALDLASSRGHVKVLEWWKNSGLPLKYTDDAITCAYHNMCYKSIKWWSKHYLPMKKYTKTQLEKIAGKCENKYYKDFVDYELN